MLIGPANTVVMVVTVDTVVTVVTVVTVDMAVTIKYVKNTKKRRLSSRSD